MTFKTEITFFILMIILIDLAQTKLTEVPLEPKRPAHFRTREDLLRYFQKVHEYYVILGRWRRRSNHDEHPVALSSNDDLFKFFDTNNDHHISYAEFAQPLKKNTKND